MKVSGFCALFLLVGTALTFFNFLSPTGASWFPDLVATNCGDRTTLIATSRKLKENGSNIRSKNKGDIGHVTLDDYNPIDPVPSAKASVNPGPIEHGTPLMPYIPKPPPPNNHPKPGDSE
ncbi:uncharacterized protein LOC133300187 [Gastrolobium bilobum]|uniref:uncharacterized protein LOC133300187 n=1 Tax=Gastrolobium bilobum TaxID=150636 RepID=UPI002AB07773|nr:uncharacterized protein LOC133300187 [Gastrolobium bilobum]